MRRSHGWSQEELAARAQKSVYTLSLLERGVNLPNLRTLVDLVDALGCSLDEVVLGQGRATDKKKPREHIEIETQVHAEISSMDLKTLRATQGAVAAILEAQR